MRPTLTVKFGADRDPHNGHLTPFHASIFKADKELALLLLHGPVRGTSLHEILWYAVTLADYPLHGRWVHKQVTEISCRGDDHDWMIDTFSYEYKEDSNEIQESRQ